MRSIARFDDALEAPVQECDEIVNAELRLQREELRDEDRILAGGVQLHFEIPLHLARKTRAVELRDRRLQKKRVSFAPHPQRVGDALDGAVREAAREREGEVAARKWAKRDLGGIRICLACPRAQERARFPLATHRDAAQVYPLASRPPQSACSR
ncbi:MAG: hypothetical protein ACXWNJ_14980 [Vulcanimicrobiaceae bacterium]